jgi:hypothetical protein
MGGSAARIGAGNARITAVEDNPPSWTNGMRRQEDRPRYWQRWLQERGVSTAVGEHVGELYRVLRNAHERTWRYARTGAVLGATLGVLASLLFFRRGTGRWPEWGDVALLEAAVVLAAVLAGWAVQRVLRRSKRLTRESRLTERELQSGEKCADRILASLADGLARSEIRPHDSQLEASQITQATIVTGLREAPTSELERNLLERLAGSSYVSTADGDTFVFKLGPPCARCGAHTRSGPLRLLNVPGHWAAANGYQRLRELPSRGMHLRPVPQRGQELADFMGKPAAPTPGMAYFGAQPPVLLCEPCGMAAVRRGVLLARDGTPLPERSEEQRETWS